MAITSITQIKLITGEVSPPETTFDALIHQTAYMFAINFYNTYKEFETVDNTDPENPVQINVKANAYLTKMFNVCQQALTSNSDAIKRLTRLMSVIIGEVISDEAALDGMHNANKAIWESFTASKMDEAFEYYSNVRKDEKAGYLAL